MFKIYHFKKLSSTNYEARKFSAGSIIIADTQTKGKGRLKRKWSSSKGGVYMSIVLKPKIKNLNKLTIIAVKAVQRTLKKLDIATKIKFPNDLQYKGKKICGILTENIFKNDKIEKMIIGIGINTNNPLPKSLESKAITLKKIMKKGVNNKKIINKLLKEFNLLY
ncbi:biotin--[acetyl-CoA-carboxylase] ligase [Candidatus Woesearchaeota archaeon]|nr:biotin--[acetyl-CoA-carboxylase] ligase [Candidatus Woesearchaeota archaeon]